jgi:hypothetical protein
LMSIIKLTSSLSICWLSCTGIYKNAWYDCQDVKLICLLTVFTNKNYFLWELNAQNLMIIMMIMRISYYNLLWYIKGPRLLTDIFPSVSAQVHTKYTYTKRNISISFFFWK